MHSLSRTGVRSAPAKARFSLPIFSCLSCISWSLLGLATTVLAEPLSKKVEIDFFRDSSSRNLKGLATRSDGRIVAGPVFTDLKGAPLADLLWSLSPSAPNTWLIGTGPEGKILELSLDPAAAASYTVHEFAKLDDTQVFVVERLSDGRVIAGTSPNGGVFLLDNKSVVARASLPADSILDLRVLGDGSILIATGNPGRIYRLDLAKFAEGGVVAEKITDTHKLTERGFSLFGEIRDRNVRRLAILPDGRVLAGSAPKGNVYSFSRDGGSPIVLQENRDAEVTDLLVTPDGDVYASLVFAASGGTSRITRPSPAGIAIDKEPAAASLLASPEPPAPERFTGRSTVVWFPKGNGFPETLVARTGVAFYRLARRGDQLIVAGGEQGDMIGYDLKERRSMTFAGSGSAQLNGLSAIDDRRYLALRNNSPGLALVDFASSGPRELETRRLDISASAQLGAIRFGRLRDVSEGQISLSLKTNFGSDELEGWTPWTTVQPVDGGWRSSEPVRGRYIKLRLQVPANAPSTFEIERAQVHYLPQNRRPALSDFRLFSANYAILPMPGPAPQATSTLSQILGQTKDNSEEKRRNAFLASPIVPAPGMQIAYWTLNDPDGDKLAATFSIRRDGDSTWTDLAMNTEEFFAQFDTSNLKDGLYFTRLVVTEQAPRPLGERLTTTFETDDLLVDKTPPDVVSATIERKAGSLVVTVSGRDALSLVEGVEFRFNNGLEETVDQPVDGIRDGREETFVLEIPSARIANATNVEVVLYDAVGNSVARRLSW